MTAARFVGVAALSLKAIARSSIASLQARADRARALAATSDRRSNNPVCTSRQDADGCPEATAAAIALSRCRCRSLRWASSATAASNRLS